MSELTDQQAAVVRVASLDLATLDSEHVNLVPWAFEWEDVHGYAQPEGLSDAGREALTQYDADQAAKRAAEVEAAYREGFRRGNGYIDMADTEYAEVIDKEWAESNAKKSLEAK
jgi:hypothetical protein